MTPDVWPACYASAWDGLIVPEAMSHPAKLSRSLIQRIYQHAKAEGWLRPGATVLDPFGGVACGALDALLMGYQWVGCEIERRFVDLGQQNLAFWARRFGVDPQAAQAPAGG